MSPKGSQHIEHYAINTCKKTMLMYVRHKIGGKESFIKRKKNYELIQV